MSIVYPLYHTVLSDLLTIRLLNLFLCNIDTKEYDVEMKVYHMCVKSRNY